MGSVFKSESSEWVRCKGPGSGSCSATHPLPALSRSCRDPSSHLGFQFRGLGLRVAVLVEMRYKAFSQARCCKNGAERRDPFLWIILPWGCKSVNDAYIGP